MREFGVNRWLSVDNSMLSLCGGRRYGEPRLCSGGTDIKFAQLFEVRTTLFGEQLFATTMTHLVRKCG